MNKYDILVNVLDELRNEAPKGYKRYYPPDNNKEKLDAARSRAFIHLFLKVNYGICEFNARENYITDDAYDGGIDAYFIDHDKKSIVFIQSKFRTTQENFENKEISYDEILKMDVDRIVDGYRMDEDGTSYNSKILNMMDKISSIPDIGRYSYEVILLANIKQRKESKLRRLTGGFAAKIYNYESCYSTLLFPVITGCYFNADEININLSLANKEGNEGRISYTVQTEFSDCKIMVTFAPLIEIAKILYKYKNSILKFNPRCYLGLKNNGINLKIENTIKYKKTNEFALFNNGITILSDKTQFNSQIALKDSAQLIITNPQIINGGQTSYTLSALYEECLEKDDFSAFDNKEVLVKIITFFNDGSEEDQQKKLMLIEDLSRATNEQSVVKESDRRSNDRVLINYQKNIFHDFGYFYNRKRGEFYEGLNKKYISRELVIDPSIFMRVAVSINGDIARARRNGDEYLFREVNFNNIFQDTDIYKKYMFGYFCHQYLCDLEKKFERKSNNKYGENTYGHALRYGKYAVVNVVSGHFLYTFETINYKKYAIDITERILEKWLDFEKLVSSKFHNSDYFYQYKEDGNINIYYNFDGYYKGRTINRDIQAYDFGAGDSFLEAAVTIEQ